MVLTIRPAPVRKTRAMATWATTSALRSRSRPAPAVPPRAAPFNEAVSSGFEPERAGAMLNTSAVASETRSV